VPCLGFKLIEQCPEQFLPFAPLAEVQVRGGTGQRKQLAQQRDIVVIPHARGEQCPQFAELGIDRIVAGKPGSTMCHFCPSRQIRHRREKLAKARRQIRRTAATGHRRSVYQLRPACRPDRQGRRFRKSLARSTNGRFRLPPEGGVKVSCGATKVIPSTKAE
jgi:hypothetical protein